MQLISPSKKIVVLGSLNAHTADRAMGRDEINSMQIIDDNIRVTPVHYFDSWGELGLSSMCWSPKDPSALYVATGSSIYCVNVDKGRVTDLEVPGLGDIHEISMYGNAIWVSNTKDDELVCYDTSTSEVSSRINLKQFRSKEPSIANEIDSATDDKFHVNQVFRGYDDSLYALMHAVTGHQRTKRLAQKLVKSQGQGGVVNVTEGTKHSLNLKAPHSVRLINDEYWVFDSARFKIAVFDQEWNLVRELETPGFGRGGAFDTETAYYYAGISATRKRYMGLLPSNDSIPNLVQVVDTNSYRELGRITLDSIEQINNIYCIDNSVAHSLLELRI